MQRQYTPIASAIIISLAIILTSTLVASIIGISKAAITQAILTQARMHAPTEQAAQATVQDALYFLNRTHTHAQGLGVTALVVALVIAHTALKPVFQFLFSLAISLGAAFYALCLLYVGILAGAKGKAAAVADMHYLAMGSVITYGAVMGILIGVLVCYYCRILFPVRFLFVAPDTPSERTSQPVHTDPMARMTPVGNGGPIA